MFKLFGLSEKKIIITCLFLVFIFSTLLFFLMLAKDAKNKQRNKILNESYSKEEITNIPKIEIEISK